MPTALPLPRTKVKKLSEPTPPDTTFGYKILLYGPSFTGKSRTIASLLKNGHKVLVLSTDFGGSGLKSVKDLLTVAEQENCYECVLYDYDSIITFLNTPFDEEIDWIVWDGFSSFQQHLLPEKISEVNPKGSERELVFDDSLQAGTVDWNVIRTGTMKALEKFFSFKTKIGKIVTCLESNDQPMLVGAAAKLILPAFNLMVRTRIESEGDLDVSKFICKSRNNMVQSKIEVSNLYEVWQRVNTVCN